ncbi:MAG: hypothetical protein WKF84_03070 [Pyrinomonadaceae bacterium]
MTNVMTASIKHDQQQVPLLDLKAQHALLRDELAAAIVACDGFSAVHPGA